MSVFTQRAMASSGNNHQYNPNMPSSSSNRGSLASFSSSVWSPAAGSVGRREESYHLLLELCSQEPTIQCCFKIIESTCLARGIDMEIRGKPPSPEFRTFVSRWKAVFNHTEFFVLICNHKFSQSPASQHAHLAIGICNHKCVPCSTRVTNGHVCPDL